MEKKKAVRGGRTKKRERETERERERERGGRRSCIQTRY